MEEEKEGKVEIITISDVKEKMLHGLRHGREKGSTTHIPEMDNCWKWRKKEMNIWTGYMNEGKSNMIRFLSIIKVLQDDWRFLFCAPEDYPAEDFFDDIVHTIAGQTTDKDRPNCISEERYLAIIERIKDNIIFVNIEPPNNTIKRVLETYKPLIEKYKIDVAIIDPLIKFARPKNFSERDDIYAAYITSICVAFARKHNLSFHLVLHQLTPRIQESNGCYPKPSAYNIKGGGTWADGSDNVLGVWRPHYAKDKFESTEVHFESQKIKKQKLVAVPQGFTMKFDRKTNRYVNFNTGEDLFKFPIIGDVSYEYQKERNRTFNSGGK